MGRGLSDLQMWIIRRAADAPDAKDGIDLAQWRVVHEFYGIERNSIWRDDLMTTSGNQFRGQDTSAARAAVCRAFARLEQRGLVECLAFAYRRLSGIRLTDAGKLAAGRILTVNQ
jgi:hypothetical protein